MGPVGPAGPQGVSGKDLSAEFQALEARVIALEKEIANYLKYTPAGNPRAS